mmetsp:Transcript_18195/g.57236  ORF Transcript_18195/g.57236 Transcript_18195/m.57236 type:complete len:330 (+) Transcript_18195:747-1736(+)
MLRTWHSNAKPVARGFQARFPDRLPLPAVRADEARDPHPPVQCRGHQLDVCHVAMGPQQATLCSEGLGASLLRGRQHARGCAGHAAAAALLGLGRRPRSPEAATLVRDAIGWSCGGCPLQHEGQPQGGQPPEHRGTEAFRLWQCCRQGECRRCWFQPAAAAAGRPQELRRPGEEPRRALPPHGAVPARHAADAGAAGGQAAGRDAGGGAHAAGGAEEQERLLARCLSSEANRLLWCPRRAHARVSIGRGRRVPTTLSTFYQAARWPVAARVQRTCGGKPLESLAAAGSVRAAHGSQPLPLASVVGDHGRSGTAGDCGNALLHSRMRVRA